MHTNKKRIFLLDDEVDFIEEWTLFFEEEGYEVVSAMSLRQARGLVIANTPVDFFLLDINVAQLSVLPLIEEIRKRDIYKKTPIALITEGTDFGDQFFFKTHALDVRRVFEKPIDGYDVCQTIEAFTAVDDHKTGGRLACDPVDYFARAQAFKTRFARTAGLHANPEIMLEILVRLATSENGRNPSRKDLDEIEASRNTVYAALAELLDRGLICKKCDASDKRVVRHELTDEGRDLMARFSGGLEELAREGA